jgi:hypothetical protein
MKIISWHSSAYKIMKECFSGYSFVEPIEYNGEIEINFPSPEFYENGICTEFDLILMLNNVGLHVMVPKNFLDIHCFLVDTRYFTQR